MFILFRSSDFSCDEYMVKLFCIADFLPMKCYACNRVFCSEHFHYTKHNCPEAYKKVSYLIISVVHVRDKVAQLVRCRTSNQ